MKVSAQYAREHFDELEAAADRGEEVEIARDCRPALMLVPKTDDRGGNLRRPSSEMLGIFAGQMRIYPNFDSSELNNEIAAEFENSVIFPNDRA